MLDMISKLDGLFKTHSLPLFFLTAFIPLNRFETEEKTYRSDDNAPGDNFPYMAMSQNY